MLQRFLSAKTINIDSKIVLVTLEDSFFLPQGVMVFISHFKINTLVTSQRGVSDDARWIDHPLKYRGGSGKTLKDGIPTGTSMPVRAASSHSQQAMAVSMPCSVNILMGDQQRWCRSWGSKSGGTAPTTQHPTRKDHHNMNLR